MEQNIPLDHYISGARKMGRNAMWRAGEETHGMLMLTLALSVYVPIQVGWRIERIERSLFSAVSFSLNIHTAHTQNDLCSLGPIEYKCYGMLSYRWIAAFHTSSGAHAWAGERVSVAAYDTCERRGCRVYCTRYMSSRVVNVNRPMRQYFDQSPWQ